MKSHELKVKSANSPKRAGRGIAAGRGKTAGRGTKGQNARSGGKRRPGFEGGQNPLYMRLPKLKGFRSIKTPPANVTTGELNSLSVKTVDHMALAKAGLIDSEFVRVKVIVKGELKKPLSVKLDAASSGAVDLITKAGGSFSAVAAPKRQKTTKE